MTKQKPNKSSNTPSVLSQNTKKQALTSSKASVSNASWLDGWLPIVAVLAVTFFAFLPTFQSDFVNWDDDVNILQNKNLNAFTFENIINIFTTNIMGGYNLFCTVILCWFWQFGLFA